MFCVDGVHVSELDNNVFLTYCRVHFICSHKLIHQFIPIICISLSSPQIQPYPNPLPFPFTSSPIT